MFLLNLRQNLATIKLFTYVECISDDKVNVMEDSSNNFDSGASNYNSIEHQLIKKEDLDFTTHNRINPVLKQRTLHTDKQNIINLRMARESVLS